MQETLPDRNVSDRAEEEEINTQCEPELTLTYPPDTVCGDTHLNFVEFIKLHICFAQNWHRTRSPAARAKTDAVLNQISRLRS